MADDSALARGKPMPQDFEKCQAEHGKMFTKTLSDGKYLHL
jgi:hypothetical protein